MGQSSWPSLEVLPCPGDKMTRLPAAQSCREFTTNREGVLSLLCLFVGQSSVDDEIYNSHTDLIES